MTIRTCRWYARTLLLTASATSACARPPVASALRTPPEVDIALARQRAAAGSVAWRAWRRETFEEARTQGRFVLFDGAAEWCHWCHVMDETTYRDPAVLAALARRTIPVRVDIDARPDLAARYAESGWPATVIFAPDGRELARFRGYLAPARMLSILGDLDRLAAAPERATPSRAPEATSPDALDTVGPSIAAAMDGYYDTARGSWGDWQKLSLGENLAFELRRAAHGDAAALARARFTFTQQRALYDPVWGGVYQYSAGATWGDPHFEKLMVFQAETLTALAEGSARTGDRSLLDDARAIERYLTGHLLSPQGTFHATQDADLNAHDRSAAFVDGHAYYALDDRGRRALGEPRIDPHIYARENGMALAALAALDRVSPDGARAHIGDRAADAMLASHVGADHGVRHDADDRDAVRFLDDAAWLGWGLARWSEASRTRAPSRAALYRDAAVAIAEGILRDFAIDDAATLAANTRDPAAPAALEHPERPTGPNVTAARLLLWRADLDAQDAAAWTARARAVRILQGATTEDSVRALGRNLGALLCALDEAGVYPWPDRPASRVRFTERAALVVSRERPASDPARLRVELHPLRGFHVNRQFPMVLELGATAGEAVVRVTGREAVVTDASAVFVTPLATREPATPLRVTLRYALCTDSDCLPESMALTLDAR